MENLYSLEIEAGLNKNKPGPGGQNQADPS